MNVVTRRDFLLLAGTTALGSRLSSLHQDGPEFQKLLATAKAKKWTQMPIGELIGEIAMSLLDTPYVGGTLERSDTLEECIVTFEGLDCVTFYETSLGFARMLKLGGSTFEDLIRQVKFTRYRDGKLDGYLSRLHYTCDWISDNAKKRTVQNITLDLPGGTSFNKKIDYMSKHPGQYRQIAANPSWIPKVAEIELTLEKAHVPKDRIADAEPLLKTGDIVGITTSVEGLDCSHTGLCYRDKEGVVRFLHASSALQKVVLGPKLSEYVSGGSKNLGVMIARPLEPGVT